MADFIAKLTPEPAAPLLSAAGITCSAEDEPAVGRSLDRNRIRLYNAACAISFLAFRAGTPAEEKPCGRTLAEDMRWVRTALSKLTP